ncbi:MAG: CPBP family glutamic-type intramembrane protease, partial [Candidatus Brocadiia bacterium]|nr:CPBP family glutamic-type intramembrane protease [Candidatus Brocadiia bacterium]
MSNAGQTAGGESNRGASGAIDQVVVPRGRPRAGRSRFPPQHVPWSVHYAFAMLALYLVVGIFLSALAKVGFPLLTADTGPWVGAAKAGVQLGGSQAILLLVAYSFLKDRAGGGARAARVLGLEVHQPGRAVRKAIVPVVMGTGILLGWAAVQNVLIQKLGWKLPGQDVVERVHHTVSAGGPHELAMFVVLTVVVAPVVEEVLFRGLLYLPLRATLGPVSAAMGVSLLFALIHQSVVAFVPT